MRPDKVEKLVYQDELESLVSRRWIEQRRFKDDFSFPDKAGGVDRRALIKLAGEKFTAKRREIRISGNRDRAAGKNGQSG